MRYFELRAGGARERTRFGSSQKRSSIKKVSEKYAFSFGQSPYVKVSRPQRRIST